MKQTEPTKNETGWMLITGIRQSCGFDSQNCPWLQQTSFNGSLDNLFFLPICYNGLLAIFRHPRKKQVTLDGKENEFEVTGVYI